MYYPCSENKGADQLRGYREADLRLCFRICRLLVFPWGGSNIEYTAYTRMPNNIIAATEFAISMGLKEENLTTNYSESLWKTWKANNCQPNFREASKLFMFIALKLENEMKTGVCLHLSRAMKKNKNIFCLHMRKQRRRTASQ